MSRPVVKLTRRRFLYLAGGMAAALVAGCDRSGLTPPPTPPLPPTSTPQPTVPVPSAPTASAGVLTPDESAAGIPITSNELFYVHSYGSTPQVNVEAWRLVIDGLVERPLSLSYDDIGGLPSVVEMRTVECLGNPAGGPLIGNAVWEGARLGGLLERAGVRSGASYARLEAADGYYTDVPLERIAHPDTLLAYKMNSDPLPPEHGYPLRLLLPGLYGQKMPKWITRVVFTAERGKGYWESRGWSEEAAVKTNSRIDEPRDNSVVGRPVVVSGVAFAGDRAITGVEVGVDGTEWHRARLLSPPTPYAWSRWQYTWDASPGKHTLLVRAGDESGFTQAHKAEDVSGGAFPSGSDAIHWVTVEVAE